MKRGSVVLLAVLAACGDAATDRSLSWNWKPQDALTLNADQEIDGSFTIAGVRQFGTAHMVTRYRIDIDSVDRQGTATGRIRYLDYKVRAKFGNETEDFEYRDGQFIKPPSSSLFAPSSKENLKKPGRISIRRDGEIHYLDDAPICVDLREGGNLLGPELPEDSIDRGGAWENIYTKDFDEPVRLRYNLESHHSHDGVECAVITADHSQKAKKGDEIFDFQLKEIAHFSTERRRLIKFRTDLTIKASKAQSSSSLISVLQVTVSR